MSLILLETGATGLFLGDGALLRPGLPVRLEQIDRTASATLDQPALGSSHGGPIATRDSQGQLQPVQAQYATRFAVQTPVTITYPLRGLVRAQGRPESLLGRAGRRIAAILVRESGF